MRKFFAVMIIFIFGCELIFAGETEVNDATDSPLPPPSKHSVGVKEMVESMEVLIGIDSQAKGVGCLDSKYIYIMNTKNEMFETLLPAESCNFACPYCFQYRERNKIMNPSCLSGACCQSSKLKG